MASKVNGVWAIDIGSNALKALQMCHGEEGIEVVDFAYLEHPKNLASGEVAAGDKEQIVSETLAKFLEEKDLSKSEVAISIAGQNSFARFIKLPPVEPKKIPEIVQFEAVQQIPFDINEVEWDWQLMENEGSPDKEVGLFAIKNELISEVMDHFTKEKLRVTCVQITPMALYNYVGYDLKELESDPRRAVIILDVGTENTTLVICTRDTVWQRSIRMGGNTFTEAIADAFKKNFPTAEKLKRTAPMSKYMRQIYTAMKSVYSDFGSEIQRSLGFYSSSPQGRDKTFSKVIAVGGGMKLQGLAKYLTQSLGVTVIKPDSFERLGISPEISTAKFHENVSDFAVAYGLGVQLLGEAKIRTNMLPRKIARAMAWTLKAKVFTAAASVLLLVMVLGVGRAYKDLSQYKGLEQARTEISTVINRARNVSSQVSEELALQPPLEEKIDKVLNLYKYREVTPVFVQTLLQCLPNATNNPEQAPLYAALESGDVQTLMTVRREDRKQLFVTHLAVKYTNDLANEDFPQSVSTSGSVRPALRMRPTSSGMTDEMIRMRLESGGGSRDPRIGVTTPAAAGGTTASGSEQEEAVAGFTVLIEGYSPYKQISDLLDPPSAQSAKERWGMITRFENLQQVLGDVPFELFKRHDIKHLNVETDLVDLNSTKAMPSGIGVRKELERVSVNTTPVPGGRGPIRGGLRGDMGGGFVQNIITSEMVLIDPMTNEEISKTYDIITQRDIDRDPELTDKDLGRVKYNSLTGEEQFIERDHWFRIQAKFVWKDAPQEEIQALNEAPDALNPLNL